MDKFMNSTWFIRAVALALAALLFTSVNIDPESNKNTLGFSSPEIDTETVKDVPVEIVYDRENLVVTGAPKTVDVTLKGARPLVINAKNLREFKVYIDLSDPKILLGKKRVPLKLKNINEKLSATINPGYAEVTIQERVTREFPVEPDFNRSLLEEGYTADKVMVDPQSVKITGAKDIIDQVSVVKALVELNRGIDETVHREARVSALDKNLNKLNVVIEPEVVNVSVVVSIASKTVRIIPVQTGSPAGDTEIASINAEPREVTLYGKQEVLRNIDQITVPVDVSDITDDEEVTVPLPLPDNVARMSRDTVKVNIKTSRAAPDTAQEQKDNANSDQEAAAETTTKNIDNLTIETVGIPDGKQIEFLTPNDGKAGIILTGNPDELDQADTDTIQLSVDVSGLDNGKHDIPIQVKVPSGIKWELENKTATISVSDANAE
ncbi:YbbR-like domain-containing protein [Peribacillus sp. SCS-155]|uniref:CdaR family protein n=1 Tax=Peribacillus sedimenti TaxID=3115297 RepID=UPI0039060920